MTDTSYLYQYFLQRSPEDKKPEVKKDEEYRAKAAAGNSKKKGGKEYE